MCECPAGGAAHASWSSCVCPSGQAATGSGGACETCAHDHYTPTAGDACKACPPNSGTAQDRVVGDAAAGCSRIGCGTYDVSYRDSGSRDYSWYEGTYDWTLASGGDPDRYERTSGSTRGFYYDAEDKEWIFDTNYGGGAYIWLQGGEVPELLELATTVSHPSSFDPDEVVIQCIACRAGWYWDDSASPGAGGASGACVSCPSRERETSPVGATSSSQCECAPGYTRVAGKCEPCPANKYKDFTGNDACVPCPTTYAAGPDRTGCECGTGMTLQGNLCVDVNECVLDTDGCAEGCVNNVGSFLCSCGPGKYVTPMGSCSGNVHPPPRAQCVVIDRGSD